MTPLARNRRFPEITGEDNLTVFSYYGRVKSPEWRWQRRRADLRHFEIFRHGPIILDYELGEPAIRSARSPRAMSAWSAFLMPFLPFVYGYPSSSPRAHCIPTKACLLCATPAYMDLYIYIHVHARQLLPSAVPWISEDRLLSKYTSCFALKGSPHP